MANHLHDPVSANAIGTILLAASTVLIAAAFVVYRRAALRRGDSTPAMRA